MFATPIHTGGRVGPQRGSLYSNEEYQILERAAAILAVSPQDLPSVLNVTHSIPNDTLTNGFHDPTLPLNPNQHEPLLSSPLPPAYPTNHQPALTINTSPGGPENVSAAPNDLERTDEELISPFPWHCDSVQSLQWSPELACHAVAPKRLNNAVIQDGLGADLGSGATVDAQHAPLYQECFNGMPNIQVGYGVTTLVSPGYVTDFSDPSYEAGDPVSDSGNQSGFSDSSMAEGGPKFHWAGTTGISPPSSIGVRQNVNASSFDAQEWVGHMEGPAVVGYESVSSMTETYHPEGYRSQGFADELPQSFPFQALPLSATGALEGLSTQCQDTKMNGQEYAMANATAISPKHNSSQPSDTASSRTVIPASTDTSTNYTDAFQIHPPYEGALPVVGRIAKPRRPFQDEQKRVETGRTRRNGACARCKMQRIRCVMADTDMQGKCVPCLKLSRPTLSNLPCVRYKITDSRLTDKGEHPQYKWSKRWPSWDMTEVDTWRSAEVKVITITQDVLGGSVFNLQCREFIPVEGDSLERIWKKRGITQVYPRAPYAIANMKETGDALARFVANNVDSSIKHYIDVTNDKLIQSTYSMAYAMAFRSGLLNQNDDVRLLLQEVLRMWVAIRMESQSERICGEETLGMQPQFLDEEVDTFGTVSIPPIMSAQIELLTTTRILIPMRTSILRRLQRLIQANKLTNWFPNYLCLFILLHSCSILTRDENRAAKKYGLETRYVYNTFIEEMHASAETLLYYFHYNNKGGYPFAKDWTSKEEVVMAGLDEEQANFLAETAREVRRRRSEFDDIRKSGSFEDDFFFVSQLYDMDWRPRP